MNKIEFNPNNYSVDLELIQKVAEEALNAFEENNATISISFVSPEEIKVLNSAHRGIDKPTDVLSFPQIEIKNVKNRHLGDIVISLDIVEKKGEEITDVVRHGILHLLGFDHETNESDWDLSAKKINCNL